MSVAVIGISRTGERYVKRRVRNRGADIFRGRRKVITIRHVVADIHLIITDIRRGERTGRRNGYRFAFDNSANRSERNRRVRQPVIGLAADRRTGYRQLFRVNIRRRRSGSH